MATKKKEKGNYCFPNFMAMFMKKLSPRIQMESELLSIVFILVGMAVFAIYLIVVMQSAVFYKIMIGFNSAAGFVFLSSRLVTSFQQYQSYLAATGVMEDNFVLPVTTIKE